MVINRKILSLHKVNECLKRSKSYVCNFKQKICQVYLLTAVYILVISIFKNFIIMYMLYVHIDFMAKQLTCQCYQRKGKRKITSITEHRFTLINNNSIVSRWQIELWPPSCSIHVQYNTILLTLHFQFKHISMIKIIRNTILIMKNLSQI